MIQVGVFHQVIADKIIERHGVIGDCLVKRNKVRKILYNYRVPLVHHQKFLEEMQEQGLVELVNKQNIRVFCKKRASPPFFLD